MKKINLLIIAISIILSASLMFSSCAKEEIITQEQVINNQEMNLRVGGVGGVVDGPGPKDFPCGPFGCPANHKCVKGTCIPNPDQ